MSEASEVVEVHELSQRPTDYWRSWKKTANVMRLQVRQPSSPPSQDKVRPSSQCWIYILSFRYFRSVTTDDIFQLRFVCMSDTHSLTPHIKAPVPDGDVFIHAGN